MIHLSEARVEELATTELILGAVRHALIAAANGSGALNPVVIGAGLESGQTYSVKSGRLAADGIVGLKVGAYWPGNEARGLARHGSVILLLDPDSGRVQALVEGSRLNGPRTAAANALAVGALARSDAETLSVIGAGAQAMNEVRMLTSVRSFSRVLLASRSRDSANACALALAAELGLEVIPVDIEEACREADVLTTATPSRAPLFPADWIRPGTHISSMGSDQAGKQELPLDILRRATLYCDLPPQSLSIGELQHVRAEILAGQLKVAAIGEVLARGGCARISDDEITLFDSSGIALQDLCIAAELLKLEDEAWLLSCGAAPTERPSCT